MEGRGMDTGIWEEVRDKVDFAKMGKPALVGMAAILVLVAAAAGFVLSGAATSSKFEIEASGEKQASEVAVQAERGTLFVHVSGAVRNPGLYELEEGARVATAVEAAGGFADDAAIDSCNLARVLTDGEQVHIAATSPSGQMEPAAEAPANSSGKVNINTASESELESLPGIGAATARKIVADRSANGPFASVEDLTRVSGIGEKKLSALADLICV